jgi:hypothetical protein
MLLGSVKRAEVVAMSECPEPKYSEKWYHVRLGPLTVLGDGRVQADILFGVEGFPTLDRCVAKRGVNGGWDTECKTAWQA